VKESLCRRQLLTGQLRPASIRPTAPDFDDRHVAKADSCAEGVLGQRPHSFGHLATIGEACLAKRGIVCESCRDACPEAAILFHPRRGGPFLPEVRPEACTGCGACITACPASAIKVPPIAEVPGA
jgi:ferredoxin-type protein NapF